MIIPLLLKLIERCGTMEDSNFRESKKHSPCVVGCGPLGAEPEFRLGVLLLAATMP